MLTLPDDELPAGEGQQPVGPGERARQLRWVALDAIAPGLGHYVAGRRRLAALFGVPTLVVIAGAVILLASVPLARLAINALNAFAILFVAQIAVLGWRLLAVAAGIRATWTSPGSMRHGAAAVALVALVVLPQAYAGYVTNVAREEVDRVFTGETGGAWQPSLAPSPSPSPSSSLAVGTSVPTEEPTPSPTPAVPRLNVLLVGLDSGVGRNTANTDTMIVASLDPVTETVSMVSIPRDMVDVPLPDGTIYKPKLNSLYSDAHHHPSKFPGADGSGWDVLMAATGTLLGLKIDYYATVALGGFVRVVNLVGGVDVNVIRGMCDPGYHEYGFTSGFSITAGHHHLKGDQALAYARIRKAPGESDFTRAARQQEVLSGIRDAIVKRGFLVDPVALLRAIGGAMSTNVPRTLLPELAKVMPNIDRSKTYRAVITSPLVRPSYDYRGSIQIPDVAGIRALAAEIFPESGTLPAAAYEAPPPVTGGGGSGVGNCIPPSTATPAPTASSAPTSAPTETPSPRPTSGPTGSPSASASRAPTPKPTGAPVVTASPAPTVVSSAAPPAP